MEKQKRTRNFATVVYPTSEKTPENWQDILREQIIPAFISPLHDKDKNTTGEVKKAHYHIIIMFEGVKTIEQAREVFDLIGGVGIEPIKSIRAYVRYLCHLDNPEKAQYSIEDVICCSGADYQSMIESPQDKYILLGEIMDYCEQKDIVSYAELLKYARENNRAWFIVLCDNTLPVVQYLKSRSWTISNHRLYE